MSEPGEGLTLTTLRGVTATLVPHDWTWARENAQAIAENWRKRLAERPSMFDGIVLLACGLAIAEGQATVSFFETRFSNLVTFRDFGWPDGSVHNAFAALVAHSSDGAVLLGRMAPHTANGGEIYFPCGTPDRSDVVGSAVDLAASAAREFAEETGLPLPADAAFGDWVLVQAPGQLAFLRPAHFADSAEALRARFAAHNETLSRPELADLIAVRGDTPIDRAATPGFVRAYLDHCF